MNFVGVLKEHEHGLVRLGSSIEDLEISKNVGELGEILSYLGKGVVVIPLLQFEFDKKSGAPIGSLTFYTDGKWIWPSYFKYYLEKGYYSRLFDAFIIDIKRRGFLFPNVTESELVTAQKFYLKIYNPKS